MAIDPNQIMKLAQLAAMGAEDPERLARLFVEKGIAPKGALTGDALAGASGLPGATLDGVGIPASQIPGAPAAQTVAAQGPTTSGDALAGASGAPGASLDVPVSPISPDAAASPDLAGTLGAVGNALKLLQPQAVQAPKISTPGFKAGGKIDPNSLKAIMELLKQQVAPPGSLGQLLVGGR